MLIPRKLHSKMNIRSVALFILLLCMGLAGNYFNLSFGYGIDFVFGSIAVLIIVHLYGTVLGTIAAIIISSYTYVIWNHYYAIIILTTEALFMGIVQRYGKKNIVLLNGLYWVVIGMPLIWLLHYNYLNVSHLQALLIMLKSAINGIFNVLIVSFIITWIPIRRWIFSSNEQNTIELNQIFFDIIVMCILFPALFVSLAASNNECKHRLDYIRKDISIHSNKITNMIYTWQRQHSNAITVLGKYTTLSSMDSSLELHRRLEITKETFPDFHNLYFADSKGVTIAFYPKPNEKGESSIGLDFSDRDYYKQLKRTLKPTMSHVFIDDRGLSNPTVALSAPIIAEDKFAGFVLGTLNLKEISEMLESNSENGDLAITIIDSNNNVIATTYDDIKPMDNFRIKKSIKMSKDNNFYDTYFSKDNDLSVIRKLGTALYVYRSSINENIPWTLIIEKCLIGYQEYLQRFFIIFLLTYASFLVAALVTRILSNYLLKLIEVTTSLPEKIFKQQPILWPKSKVNEISLLIQNFKTAVQVLYKNFQQIQGTNKKLEYLAEHDALTYLPNRAMFKKNLDRELIEAKTTGKLVGVLFIDTDEFKYINDTMGHSFGDQLLKRIAKRLNSYVKSNGTVSRIGGDEFTLILPNASSDNEIKIFVENMIKRMRRPYFINGYEIYNTISVGVAIYPRDGENPEILLRNADTAMYTAKALGKNSYKFYSPNMTSREYNIYEIGKELHNALEREEFELFYQPQIEIKSNKIVGLEALIRWNHPKRGMVSPNEFISMAEETGLMVKIGEWILKAVCIQNKLWQNKGFSPKPIAVNISLRQFQERNFVDKISRILDETGLESQWLGLDITESIIIKDIDHTMERLKKLKEIGITISLDDFGMGFSSLNYLKNFKINSLKIDSSFIKEIGQNRKNDAIVATMIFLAKNLGLKVIAEGVESKEQLNFLKKLNCDEMQGYLFSKPLCVEDIEKLMSTHKSQ